MKFAQKIVTAILASLLESGRQWRSCLQGFGISWRGIFCISASLTTISFSVPTNAAVLFSDNFEDGNVLGWMLVSNHNNPFLEATPDAATGIFGMETYFVPGQTGGGFHATARTTFAISQAVKNVSLSFSSKNVACDTCFIGNSYSFLSETGGGLSSDTFSHLTYTSHIIALPDLTPGTYGIELGVFASQAFSGRFSAKFDDVIVTGTPLIPAVPEPSSWAMMVAGFGLLGAFLRRWTAISRPSPSPRRPVP